MRIIFMGTPDFAVPALHALLDAGEGVLAVYTQPPRPAGRGLAPRKSPVQLFAEQAGLPVLTPETLKGEAVQGRFADFAADVAVVVAYGLILPKTILETPTHGCLNLHASLLPRWRGAAPIQRAIMAGDKETGISVMRMEEGLDTGPVCMEKRVTIGADETAGELHDRLARLGAPLLPKTLAELALSELDCHPQDGAMATYANKITPGEARIDWASSAQEVHDQIRGLSPHPGAWFELTLQGRRERIKVLRSALSEASGPAGTVLSTEPSIACGQGSVRLTELQRAGKRPMPAAEFGRGTQLPVGLVLD